jgi:mono/diheme cytochrome c family protein
MFAQNYLAALRGGTCIKLIGLALAGLTLTGCWGNRSEDPPVHIIWNMDFQDKWDPQEPTDFFPDKRAARPEVPGTVARGYLKDPKEDLRFLKDDDLLWRGRDFDGRLADRLPDGMTLDAAMLERGRERYNIYCSPCHDQTGRGAGMATLRGGGFKVQPKSLHDPNLLPMPLGYFFEVITNGKGTMLPYAAQIPVEDRWAIVTWVRALQIHGKDKGWAPAPMAADAAGAAAPAAKKEGSQ